jgi:broad specificity phosphatase PhoE
VTRLFIWRHGQTEWNAINRVQGQTDVALDSLGRAQAIAAAASLAAERPDVIVASDLRRAADTAGALASVTGLPVHFDPRLRERHFGSWQGMDLTDIEAAYPVEFQQWRRGAHVDGCGLEEIDDLAKRAGAGALDAVARADGGTVVIATHGGTSKYILGELLGWSQEVTARLVGLSNCHWSELRLDDTRGWTLRSYNVGRSVD